MATPRNPMTGRWTFVPPPGAAVSQSPGWPQPGPAAIDSADSLPLLTFAPGDSPCQQLGDLSAVSAAPGDAGPRPTNPTTPMQDFGQRIGETVVSTLPDGDIASSG